MTEREKCISQALDDIVRTLAARPPDRYGRRFVVTRRTATLQIVFCNPEKTQRPDGPLQQILTLDYGERTQSLLAQLWPLAGQAPSETPVFGLTPIAPDNPQTWTTLLAGWIDAVSRTGA